MNSLSQAPSHNYFREPCKVLARGIASNACMHACPSKPQRTRTAPQPTKSQLCCFLLPLSLLLLLLLLPVVPPPRSLSTLPSIHRNPLPASPSASTRETLGSWTGGEQRRCGGRESPCVGRVKWLRKHEVKACNAVHTPVESISSSRNGVVCCGGEEDEGGWLVGRCGGGFQNELCQACWGRHWHAARVQD